MTVRVYSDQAGTTAAAANDNIGKVEDLSRFDSDGVSSTTGPYLSVDANGFGSADILAQGGDVVQTFTNAIADGSALVVGTSKCIFFSNVNVEAGGTLTIGPAGDMINTNGLNLIGKVVSVATTTKVLTTAEQNSIATFFAARGASSVIVNDETVYDVNSVEADVVLDFTGDSFYRNVPHYFKLGGTYTTFAEAFTGNSPKLTYSTAAGSNSTMVNSAGNIVWAPHNLVTYSEEFSQWSDGSISNGSRTNGSLTVSTSEGYAYVSSSFTTPTAVTHVIEVDVTCDTTVADVPLRAGLGANNDTALASFSAGETKRVSFSVIPASGTLTIGLDARDAVIPGGSNATGYTVTLNKAAVYRSDLGGMAQVPQSATGFETYVPTNGNAEYLPRVGHHVFNGSTWVNEGLLIESEARTNINTLSNDFDTAPWSLAGTLTSVTQNQTGPDGETSAWTMLCNTVNAGHYMYCSLTVGTGDHTYSVYLKYSNHQWATLRLREGGGTEVFANFDMLNGVKGSVTTGSTSSMVDVGNGWFRCSVNHNSTATAAQNAITVGLNTSDTLGLPAWTPTGTEELYVYGAQLEAGSTPSSYMPTNGGTYTRTAQSLEVPPAEFGWPTPEYIGSELVVDGSNNWVGDFDVAADVSEWTDGSSAGGSIAWNASGYLDLVNSTGVARANLAFATVVGETYVATVEKVAGSSGVSIGTAVGAGASNGDIYIGQNNAVDVSVPFVAASTTTYIGVYNTSTGTTANIDNISVREINPLSVSLQMDGRMTYADEGVASNVTWWRWLANASDYVEAYYATDGAYDRSKFDQGTIVEQNTSNDSRYLFSPGINVPFNISSRHGSTFVNGAVDGAALPGDTTPTALPDLSATNLQIAYDFMGTIGTFRQFAGDIGDTGLVTATKPSTEPTLSLTFDGTNGSFYNLNWSE